MNGPGLFLAVRLDLDFHDLDRRSFASASSTVAALLKRIAP